MTEQQIPVLAARLVEYQAHFARLSTEEAQWVIQNAVGAIDLFVAALKARKEQTAQIANASLNFLIRVDRSVRPAYPDWMERVIHSELEATGPAEYDLSSDVKQWLHEGQKADKWVKGQQIYEHLKSNNMLEGCLGLADLLAIQQKGIAVFRKLFSGKAVFGWKSVVQRRHGHLLVPYLYEVGGEVVVYWDWLDDGNADDPALCFAR